MKYNRNVIDAIKSKIDIVDVIGERIKLDRHHKALCPFHAEKSPSISVHPSRQYFYCFGCNRGGDVIAFLQEYEKRPPEVP